MNAHYMFPNAFDASSPDSVSPPMSASGTTPEHAFTHDVRLPEFTSEIGTFQHGRIQTNPRGLYSSHNYNYPHSPGPDPVSGSLTDFDFAKSLRDVHTSRAMPSHSQNQGRNGSEGSDGPTESEAAVAETIVRARKSWKTVKGRSEPVWPPHLEKALVQALLQYKPHDSRYARALGRFPKRNRFISDFIFEATGVRRSPKQVGSRLQQLKDVSCGKILLNHVANWSLAPQSTPLSESDASLSPSSLGPNLSVIISNADSCGSEGSQSPISPLAGARHREGVFAEAALEPHNAHSLFNAASFAQLHRGLAGSSAPSSPYVSPPLTPFVRMMDVSVSFYPTNTSNSFSDDFKGGSGQGEGSKRQQPFMRFGGCLARPETVFAPAANDIRIAPNCKEPRVTFVARDPTAAQSVSRVCVNGVPRSSSLPISSSVLGPSPSLTQGHRGKGTKVQVHEQSQPLVCVQTPIARASTAQTSFYSFDKFGPGVGTVGKTGDEEDRDCFVYETRLVDDSLWGKMRREADLSRYTITQELMYSFDSPTTVRGEAFLIITYHFVPASPYDPSSLSPLSPLDTCGQGCNRGYARGSVSPAPSSSPSPISVNSASLAHTSLHSQQGYGSNSHAYAHSFAHAHENGGPHFNTVPPPPVLSQTGGLTNPFGQAGVYGVNGTGNVNMANGPFTDYNVDFNELNLQHLQLSTDMRFGNHPGL